MRAEQKKGTGQSDNDKPFIGVPSDQVGRGAGMDPVGAVDDDDGDRVTLPRMRTVSPQERGRSSDTFARGSGELDEDDTDISASQRPPSDS